MNPSRSALRVLAIASVLVLGGCAMQVVRAANCAASLVPDPALEHDSCTYDLIEPQTFTYSNGQMSATWDPDLQIQEAVITADYLVVGNYTPGTAVLFSPASNKNHYDFRFRAIQLSTGAEVLGMTVIYCVASGQIPSPSPACYYVQVQGCSISSTAENCALSVTCEGDHGTCSDCGSASEACCTSTVTEEVSCGEGCTKKKVTTITNKKKCPSLP